jgi:site-specific DNA-cytosine methylase
MMLMLDLFAGLGGASSAMRERGWDVVTVDDDPRFGCTHTADLSAWSWEGPRPDLVWASPPCTEFSRESMPWCRTGATPSLDLVRAAVRIVGECDPQWWAIENVRGAIKWLTPLLGKPRQSHGPFFLWGTFPRFRCPVKPFKERLSSARRAERACVPNALSKALAVACESSILSLMAPGE